MLGHFSSSSNLSKYLCKRRQEFVPPSFECQLANPTIGAFAFWPFVEIQGIKLARESWISTLQTACSFLQMRHLPLAKCRATTWALLSVFPPTFALSTGKCSICMAWQFLVFSLVAGYLPPEVLALPIYKHVTVKARFPSHYSLSKREEGEGSRSRAGVVKF